MQAVIVLIGCLETVCEQHIVCNPKAYVIGLISKKEQ